MSSPNIFLMSRIKELKDLTYTWINLSYLSLFNFFCTIQDVLFGRNCFFSFGFRWSYISILGCPTLKSSLVLVLHQSLASPIRYIIVGSIYSATLIFAIIMYCSISQKRFLDSFKLLAPPKDFGLVTLGLDVLTLLGVFVTTRFIMTIVSSLGFNNSLNFVAGEMYKLLTLLVLFVASLNRSMIECFSPSSSCYIKVSRRTNYS